MYRKIDHIGIAVRSIEAALEIYTQLFGIQPGHIEEVVDQKTRVAMLPIGESRLELLESLEEDSVIARFIAKRGEGLHHICFAVDDIQKELRVLSGAGLRLIDEVPRRGADGCLVAFLHPSSTGGVLVELSQKVNGKDENP